VQKVRFTFFETSFHFSGERNETSLPFVGISELIYAKSPSGSITSHRFIFIYIQHFLYNAKKGYANQRKLPITFWMVVLDLQILYFINKQFRNAQQKGERKL